MAIMIDFKMSMPSRMGGGVRMPVNGSTLRRWSDKQAAMQLAHGRKTLRRASAYARSVMRNSFKKGKAVKKWRMVPNGRGGFNRRSYNIRQPSKAGAPPRYWTSGRQFGIKTIVFTKLTPDKYSIGAVTRTNKRARFKLPEMREFGGRGQVKMPASLSNIKEESNLWSRISKAGGKVASVWRSAQYPARPFAEPVVKPTVEKFHDIFGR